MSWTLAALILSGITVAISTFWGIRNYRQHKLNLFISEELRRIIDATHDKVKKSKKIADEAGTGMGKSFGSPAQDMFDSPELMATIITVLIHKFGDVRLGMKDFMIRDEDYVSVYVDSSNDEIVLSLDHNLDRASAFMGFSDPDDNTFH